MNFRIENGLDCLRTDKPVILAVKGRSIELTPRVLAPFTLSHKEQDLIYTLPQSAQLR